MDSKSVLPLDDHENGDESSVCTAASLRKNFKDEIVRLMMQELKALGFSNSVEQLEKESGLKLHDSSVDGFRVAVLSGSWEKAIDILPTLLKKPGEMTQKATLLIYRQKYMELLEQSKFTDALLCLRNEISKLTTDQSLVQKITSFMMCVGEDLYMRSEWDGAQGNSRKQLLLDLNEYLKPALLIPEGRLLGLLDQSRQYQFDTCPYHIQRHSDFSFLVDHKCPANTLPSRAIKVLKEHKDEVWVLAFSNKGDRLASGSKDKSVIIWDVKNGFAPIFTLSAHKKPISCISWSPDDKFIVTTSEDRDVLLWNTETGEKVEEYKRHYNDVTSCVWDPDGIHFYTGGMDQRVIRWSIENTQPEIIAAQRAYCLSLSPDGKTIIVVDGFKILGISTVDKTTLWSITEVDGMTSLSVSHDGRYILVSVKIGEIHIWDTKDATLVRKYLGHKHGRWILKSAFVGEDEGFIASGSEDNKVYVWNRRQGSIIAELEGHTSTVNTVAWNAHQPSILVSASDDHTIRVWGPEPPKE